MTTKHRELTPVFGVIPFSAGDCETEAEVAEDEGITLAGQRARRNKGHASPWVKRGKKIVYSRVLRLLEIHQQVQRPTRAA